MVKFEVFSGVGEMIFPANDIGDAHFDIIDHIDKVKDPAAVGPTDRHIVFGSSLAILGFAPIDLDSATNEIVEG